MDFGNLLRRSWNVVWNNKFMLVLGFLAALGSGGGNASSSNFNYQFDANDFPFMEITPDRFAEIVAAAGAIAIIALCVAIVVGIVLWVIRLSAQAGMISAAPQLDAGQKLSFGQAFSAGWSKIWSMMGLNLLLFGALIVVGIIAVVALAGTVGASVVTAVQGGSDEQMAQVFGALGIIGICLACFACLLVPVYLVVTLIYPFAQRALVLEDMGVMDSVRRGWQVIRANLGDVILLVVIFVLIGFVVGAVVLGVILLLGGFSFIPVIMRIVNEQTPNALDIALACGGGLLIVVLSALINSIFVAFRSTAVTLAYNEFTSKKPLDNAAVPPAPAPMA